MKYIKLLCLLLVVLMVLSTTACKKTTQTNESSTASENMSQTSSQNDTPNLDKIDSKITEEINDSSKDKIEFYVVLNLDGLDVEKTAYEITGYNEEYINSITGQVSEEEEARIKDDYNTVKNLIINNYFEMKKSELINQCPSIQNDSTIDGDWLTAPMLHIITTKDNILELTKIDLVTKIVSDSQQTNN